MARAMCVADSYDAMSFRRPYRQALRYHEALIELDHCSGPQFDPQIVAAFDLSGPVAAFELILEAIPGTKAKKTNFAHSPYQAVERDFAAFKTMISQIADLTRFVRAAIFSRS